MFLLGGVYSAQFGMVAVYGTEIGLSVARISILVSVIYVSALVSQYPIGWLSDRMDRRVLIIAMGAAGAFGAVLATLFGAGSFTMLMIGAGFVGGTSNPLYSLLIAYANDYLEHEDMAAASAGFLFINGVGAIAGPLVIGWGMGVIGPHAFWLLITALMGAVAIYGLYRMTRRPTATPVEDMVPYTPVSPTSSPVLAEVAQEIYIDADEQQESEAQQAERVATTP